MDYSDKFKDRGIARGQIQLPKLRDESSLTVVVKRYTSIKKVDLSTLGNQWEIKIELRIISHFWVIIHQRNVSASGLERSDEFGFGCAKFKMPMKHLSLR